MATAAEQTTSVANIDLKFIASCSYCKGVLPLEACLDCFKPLCISCMKTHLEDWQVASSKYTDYIEQKVDRYLEKLKSLNPLINENEIKITKVKTEIEKSFNSIIEKLNNEKNDIFKMIDQIQRDNKQYKTFESNILELKSDFKELNEAKKNTEDIKHSLEINKFKQCKEKIQVIGNIFSDIKSKPFKIIGDYEEPKPLESNFFGNLIINESECILKHRESNKPNLKEQNDRKVHMFGTLRVKLKQIADQYSDFKQTFKNPLVEFDVKVLPSFLASYKSQVIIIDENANLVLMDSTDGLMFKSEIKLSILNVRGIAVNHNFLAVSFSDLNKDNIKAIGNKKLKISNGIILFKINDGFKFEKIIDLPKSNFISPSSLVLNEEYLFVTDRDLHSIFKFDIKTNNLVDKLVIKDSHPTGICLYDINQLIFVDSFKQELNLIDSNNISNIIKTVKINDELQSLNGPYDMVKKKDGYLFVKSRSDSRVIIFDSDLNVINVFDYDFSNYLGITLLNAQDQLSTLILGSSNGDQKKNFKIGYFRDF